MARSPRPELIRWTSSILDTDTSADLTLRARHGMKVEVMGFTTTGPPGDVHTWADVIVIADGTLLCLPASCLRRVRTEDRR